MTEPLKQGDTVMVMRDLMLPSYEPCHGSMVGSPATLSHLEPALFCGLFGPLWITKEALRCPRCGGISRAFKAEELQKLRGPEQAAAADGLVGADAKGNGWRLTETGALA